MSFYEEKTIERENGGETINVLVLKQDISTIDMEKLSKVFEAIGYFKATDVIKGKLSGIFS